MIRSVIWAVLLAAVSVENASVSNLKRTKRGSVTEDNNIMEAFYKCKCVRHYQCKDGNIITNGTGIIERRISKKPPVFCKSEDGTIKGDMVCCSLGGVTNEPVNTRSASETFPWMAAIFHKTQGQYRFKCGGSLVHPKAILTASHCLDDQSPQDLVVVVNGKEKLSFEGTTEKERRYVSQIVRHHKYANDTLFYDAALLILKEEFEAGGASNIQILSLPVTDRADLGPYECYVAGWGEDIKGQNSSTLKKQKLPFVEHSRCQELLRKTALGEYFILDESFMCAGGEAGKDACTGDGGSPLACKPSGAAYFQAGIVSWGMACWRESVPGVYTDTQKISEWIQNAIDNNI